MIEVVGPSCFGCGACVAACPKKCISFERREFGHLYPVVEESACVMCSQCVRVCPALKGHESEAFCGQAYALQALESDLIIDSSSGGAFSLIAEQWIEGGGVVYGAAWDPSLGVRHVRAGTLDALKPLRRSKYVQSSLAGVFESIGVDFAEGVRVLFSGTPCQVSAIKSAFHEKASYGQLVTIDLVCHGVPSAALFEDYIVWLEDLTSKHLVEYNSRDKEIAGWSCIGSYRTTDEKAIPTPANDPYLLAFSQGVSFRDSCYKCPFACPQRVGDITLGDFWGVERLDLGLEATLGVSSVLANTDVGDRLISRAKGRALIAKVSFEAIAEKNQNLFTPTREPEIRESVGVVYEEKGFPSFAAETRQAYKREILRARIKRLLPARLRHSAKRTLGRMRARVR